MRSEPTAIIELVRTLLILGATFGVAITAEQEAAIIAAAGALAVALSWGLAYWNRNRVYAPDTVQTIADHAAATGVASIGEPPKGVEPVE